MSDAHFQRSLLFNTQDDARSSYIFTFVLTTEGDRAVTPILTAHGPRRLILASQSPYRRELMDRLRLPYEAAPHGLDEERPDPSLHPRDQVPKLAREKAESLRQRLGDGLVIASDQGLVRGDELLGKPGSAERACEQLEALAGGTHDLVTAVAVLDVPTGRLAEHTEIYRLRFRALSDAEIRRYVALDQPLDCAGSFRIESLGVALFEGIDGTDPTGIMGLPLIHLVGLLARFGVSPLA
jgi:septum formation protein